MEGTYNVTKDIGEIHSRLFDHRPVLHGEISFFVKEFEEKRKNREHDRLNKILEHQKEIIENSVPKSIEAIGENLTTLTGKVTVASEMCERILEKEEERSKEDQLATERKARVDEWSRFMTEMFEKSAKVDGNFESEVNQLKQQYEELEEKLRISPITP